MVKHQSHNGAIGKDNVRKDQVKFLGLHDPFSAHIPTALQDEAPILKKFVAARDLMPVTRARKAATVEEVLWADDKSKPYKNNFWGPSLMMVCKLTLVVRSLKSL